ncbi:MAG TPA: hypothetical protein VLA77_02190 [Candidatus Saccharimonadales bacterium]|nr:hypothetical protein [Candidatus Saccharimonadales bacterium]
MSEGFDVLPIVVVLALVAFGAALAIIDKKYARLSTDWNEFKKR